jgi:hypothetical protein
LTSVVLVLALALRGGLVLVAHEARMASGGML